MEEIIVAWCPDCGLFLWDEDNLEYRTVCPKCGKYMTVDDMKDFYTSPVWYEGTY